MSERSGRDGSSPLSEWGSVYEKLNTPPPFANTLTWFHAVLMMLFWSGIVSLTDALLVHTEVVSASVCRATSTKVCNSHFTNRVLQVIMYCPLLFNCNSEIQYLVSGKRKIILLKSWIHNNGRICNEAAYYPPLFKSLFFALWPAFVYSCLVFSTFFSVTPGVLESRFLSTQQPAKRQRVDTERERGGGGG